MWTAGRCSRLGCSLVRLKVAWRVPVSYTAQQVGLRSDARLCSLALLVSFFSLLAFSASQLLSSKDLILFFCSIPHPCFAQWVKVSDPPPPLHRGYGSWGYSRLLVPSSFLPPSSLCVCHSLWQESLLILSGVVLSGSKCSQL